ncbi:MAG: hypothetical protein OEL55_01170 [Desulfobulbaceae bacterium]|nr:hypothetical protein [Desulfobulbaceae bacterium]
MRDDQPARLVIATCCVGLGFIAFRLVRLVGVCSILVGDRMRRGGSRVADAGESSIKQELVRRGND